MCIRDRSRNFVKTVTKHIWHEYVELAEDARYTPKYKELYIERKEKIERVFADAKEKHAMRFTPYRGLTAVTNWVRLKFAAMNLKKFAIHKDVERKLKQKHRDKQPTPCNNASNISFAHFVFHIFQIFLLIIQNSESTSREFRVFLQAERNCFKRNSSFWWEQQGSNL